jgi:HprK-related kinase A
MRVADCRPDEFRARLRGRGLGIQVGPFAVLVRSEVDALDGPLARLYGDHPLLETDAVFSCHVALRPVRRLFPRPRRLVRFTVDGRQPHEDHPLSQALAVFEWGLNLVIAMRAHAFLMLHSAVVERGGRALLLPAEPGDGKSTLCAALAGHGWRLLSDEFALLRPGSTDVLPMPRPMPLKNESIEVIRRFLPDAEFGPVIPGTRKGTVAHLRPSADSVLRQSEPARARWVVFPKWRSGAALSLEPVAAEEGFMRLASNAFNYEVLGEAAFSTVRRVIDGARCYSLVYSDLAEAIRALAELEAADGG